jgi:hypothetical protein
MLLLNNGTLQNSTLHNGTLHNGTLHNVTVHYKTEHYETVHKNYGMLHNSTLQLQLTGLHKPMQWLSIMPNLTRMWSVTINRAPPTHGLVVTLSQSMGWWRTVDFDLPYPGLG